MWKREVILNAALEEFHKEACAKGYSCTRDEAIEAIEKQAELFSLIKQAGVLGTYLPGISGAIYGTSGEDNGLKNSLTGGAVLGGAEGLLGSRNLGFNKATLLNILLHSGIGAGSGWLGYELGDRYRTKKEES